jgi:hypothetical protein
MLGIVLALNVFFYAVRTQVFPAPQYDQYCPAAQMPAPQTEAGCTAVSGSWIANPSDAQPNGPKGTVAPQTPMMPAGYCDVISKCQQPFQNAQDAYHLKAFVMMVAFGVLALIIGVLPIGSSIVSTGLSYGGVLAFLVASIGYWSEASSWVRLAISALALIALIYIGIRRFRD